MDLFVSCKAKVDYSFLSMVDAMIVACAKSLNGIIVSSDSDFSKVKNVKFLKLNY